MSTVLIVEDGPTYPVALTEVEGGEVTVTLEQPTVQTVQIETLIQGPAGPPGAPAYAEDIGDGVSTSILVEHGLNTLDVGHWLYRLSDRREVEAGVTRTDENSITLGFEVAPTLNQYRVVVMGRPSPPE